jgi:hypothetical protein
VEKRRYKRIKRAAEHHAEEEEAPAVETFDTLKDKLAAAYQDRTDTEARIAAWDREASAAHAQAQAEPGPRAKAGVDGEDDLEQYMETLNRPAHDKKARRAMDERLAEIAAVCVTGHG